MEDHLSKYVVVSGIQEENWATSRLEGVCRYNSDVAWGHWCPLMVSKVWKKLAVKVEVRDAAAEIAVVKSGVVVGMRRFGAQLAIVTGGRGVLRGGAAPKGRAQIGKPVERQVTVGVVWYGCGRIGYL